MKNNYVSKLVRSLAVGACLLASTAASHAIRYQFTVDTSALAADSASTYAVDFQLTGGDPASNSASISHFSFGFGHASAAPEIFGDVTGDLFTTLTLTDSTSSFFNEYYREFVAGSKLSFWLDFESGVNTPTPDTFAFTIYKNGVDNIAGLGGSLIRFDLDSAAPVLQLGEAEGVTVTVPDNGTSIGLLAMTMLGLVAVHQSRLRRFFAQGELLS